MDVKAILEAYRIRTLPTYIGPSKMIDGKRKSPEKWEAPPQSVFKLNFDGAAKGNPSLVGVGGAY